MKIFDANSTTYFPWTLFSGPEEENPFRREGYLLMNQALGGTAGGPLTGTEFPVRYRIDWIRQWVWDESITDGVTVSVTNSTGSGIYKPGTKATAAAGQPPTGQVFDSWTVLSGDVTLDDPNSETTVSFMLLYIHLHKILCKLQPHICYNTNIFLL